MPKKEPLYPHKTPAQLSQAIHIIKAGKAMVQADEEPWYFPKDAVYPVEYTEVLAGVDDKSYATHITYSLYPALRLGYIELVAVDSKDRRKGLGRQLVEFAIDDMKKQGIAKVSVGLMSQEGFKLFGALGFTITENKVSDLEPYVATKNL